MLRGFLEKLFNYWEIEVKLFDSNDAAISYIDMVEDQTIYSHLLLEIREKTGCAEILKKCKEKNPEVKLIACCNNHFQSTMLNFASYGFDKILIKPFRIEDLKKTLELDLG